MLEFICITISIYLQVTESQEIVLTGDHEKSLSPEQMLLHIQHLIKEREKYLQVFNA